MARAVSDGGAPPSAAGAERPLEACNLFKSVSASAAAMGAAADAAGGGGRAAAGPEAGAPALRLADEDLARRSDLAPTARPFLPAGLEQAPGETGAPPWSLFNTL